MRVTILGCGASGGVPLLGCDCEVCRSSDRRNRRRRCSVLVEAGRARILIDASPDLRGQLLDAGVSRLDAVLFTHAHADHCHGIDDLRLVCRAMRGPLEVFGDRPTLEELGRRFAYAFAPVEPGFAWFRPVLVGREVGGPLELGGAEITSFAQRHGPAFTTLGYRIGAFAYSTDVSELSDDAFAALEGITTWVVDCQGYRPNYVHSHLERTLGWIETVRPRRAVLTHMGHEFDYATLAGALPDGVEPAYDGLVLDVEP